MAVAKKATTSLPPLRCWPAGQDVPAISVRQPWASAICWCGKSIENRSSWPFRHRGPLVIHASRTPATQAMVESFAEKVLESGVPRARFFSRLERWSEREDLGELINPYGAIVAVSTLAEVFEPGRKIPAGHPASGSPWANDEAYRLFMTDITPVRPVEFKGRFGLFKVPYKVILRLEPLTGLGVAVSP